jgi:uncharacterized RDD family membrane protein YckC
VIGAAFWLVIFSVYLTTFWSLAGQTPGMRFVGIRLAVDGRGLPFGRSVKRLIGLGLAWLAFGIGFLGILFDERRRAWDDRLSGVDVRYEENERAFAPWSRLAPPPVDADASSTTKAPGSRGLRPQQAVGPR